ncbi:MAG TPA: hypothetical protein VN852_05710 [Candidatus Krumholzibacteria bacterium]|jgi:hypothetical protein|nr:hypothetical protein [Candidatus Krumholzibacteria bacterium]
MNAELIGIIANISLALSLIVALVFGISQVRAAGRDRRERLTLETLRFFGSREFAELLQYVETHPAPKSRPDLRTRPAAEQTMIIQFTMQMENLGILVAEKMIDLDLVDETLGSFVVTTWAKYKSFAVATRQEDNEPFMSEYYQWLAETIDERIKANPRPPAYESLPRHH